MPDSWGSFMNKPARGWLHPDNVITRSSVCYEVRVNFHDYFVFLFWYSFNILYNNDNREFLRSIIFFLVYEKNKYNL